LTIDSGPDLFDADQASDAKIKPRHRDLKKLESVLQEIVKEGDSMIKVEYSLRDTNESTNERVKWFSIFAVVVLVCSGIWQIFYLKKFFKSKKLI
jgi:hypothetical protein